MKHRKAWKAILLAAAFTAATLQGSRLPEDLEWDGAVVASGSSSDRVCTLSDERAGWCTADRMWA
jgi:hypothetical protein